MRGAIAASDPRYRRTKGTLDTGSLDTGSQGPFMEGFAVGSSRSLGWALRAVFLQWHCLSVIEGAKLWVLQKTGLRNCRTAWRELFSCWTMNDQRRPALSTCVTSTHQALWIMKVCSVSWITGEYMASIKSLRLVN